MRDSYKTFPLLQPYHSCIEFLLMLLHIKSIQMANQGVAFIVNEIQEMHFFFVTKVRGDCDCSSKTTFLVFFFFFVSRSFLSCRGITPRFHRALHSSYDAALFRLRIHIPPGAFQKQSIYFILPR